MGFVAINSVAQQASRGLERSRDLLVKQHTQLMNCVRGLLFELGVVAAQGRPDFAELAARIEANDARIPEALTATLRMLVAQIEGLRKAIASLEEKIITAAKKNATMRRLCTIPGVGGLTAHTHVAAIGAGGQFRSARDFAA